MNSKGTILGTTIVSLFILVPMVIILAVYLFYVGQLTLFNDNAFPESTGLSIPEDFLLLKSLEIEGRKVSVFDKLVLSKKGFAKEEMRQFLFDLMNSEAKLDSCLFLFEGEPRLINSVVLIEYRSFGDGSKAAKDSYPGAIDEEILKLNYRKKEVFDFITFTDVEGEKREFSYYQGGCLHE